MTTTIINIKTEPEIKREAQEVAKEIGVSLSALINAYLKQLIRTKKIEFSLEENPNGYLRNIMRITAANRKKGKNSPIFRKGKDAVLWLEEQGV